MRLIKTVEKKKKLHDHNIIITLVRYYYCYYCGTICFPATRSIIVNGQDVSAVMTTITIVYYNNIVLARIFCL